MKTHQWFIIVLAFLIGSAPSIAQEGRSTTPHQALSKDYVSPDHRFKIDFPDVPKEFDLQADTQTGAVVSHQVMLDAEITYWLNFADYPINLERGAAVKATLDKARDGGLARVAKEDPRIVSESDISLDGHPGRFLRVELKGDAIVRFKIVLNGNRLYVLSVGSPKSDPKNVNAQRRYEKLATTFFDSFKIIPPLEADLTAAWTEFISSEGNYRIKFPGAPCRWTLPLEELSPPSTLYVHAYNSSSQYSAMYMDYAETPAPTDRAALTRFLDELRDGQMQKVEQMGAKATMVSESDITFDGYAGRFLVVNIINTGIYREKTIIVKGRVYFLTVMSPRDDPQASDPKVYEKLSAKFMSSFELIKQ